MVFGDKSLNAREIADWLKFMDDNESNLNEAYKIDSDVRGKICGQIDRSLSQFLGSLIAAKDVNAVNWNMLSMECDRMDILKNKLRANLPAFLVRSIPVMM